MFRLNRERNIWIQQEELGKDIKIKHDRKRYTVKVPPRIDKKVTIRLRGLGRTKGNETGDLLLHMYLNKGDDARAALWLSETAAKTGAKKIFSFEGKKIQILIPPESRNGIVVRLKGLGRYPDFSWRAPFLRRKRGNLLVKLIVFPDSITPRYRPVEALTDDEIVMDARVFRMRDEIINRLGESSFKVNPVKADEVTDVFNQSGWRGISRTLVKHLKLNRLDIQIEKSTSMEKPGNCQKFTTMQGNVPVRSSYRITVNEQFLDNPFSVAAILAHELCHVVYSEKIDVTPKGIELEIPGNKKEPLEQERMVDLLVFMFKIGEFQLRASRDKRLTFGYFNQDTFERIQVIVSRMKSQAG